MDAKRIKIWNLCLKLFLPGSSLTESVHSWLSPHKCLTKIYICSPSSLWQGIRSEAECDSNEWKRAFPLSIHLKPVSEWKPSLICKNVKPFLGWTKFSNDLYLLLVPANVSVLLHCAHNSRQAEQWSVKLKFPNPAPTSFKSLHLHSWQSESLGVAAVWLSRALAPLSLFPRSTVSQRVVLERCWFFIFTQPHQ